MSFMPNCIIRGIFKSSTVILLSFHWVWIEGAEGTSLELSEESQDLSDHFKRWLWLMATVDSVLLYRAQTWVLTVQQEKSLDGVYTRMLWMALNVPWEIHTCNIDLYTCML